MARLTNRERGARAAHRLSEAQFRVFREMLRGGDSAAIAKRAGISISTARNHINAIFAEFKVHSRVDILAMFVVPPWDDHD